MATATVVCGKCGMVYTAEVPGRATCPRCGTSSFIRAQEHLYHDSIPVKKEPRK